MDSDGTSNLAFYIEGDERAVRVLKLRLYVNNPARGEEAKAKFEAVSKALVEKVAAAVKEAIRRELLAIPNGSMYRDLYRLTTRSKDFPGAVSGRHETTLTIAVIDDCSELGKENPQAAHLSVPPSSANDC